MRPLSGRNFLKSQEGCSHFLTEGRIGALRNGIVFSDHFSHVAGLSSTLHIFDDLSEEANLGLFDNLEEASKTNLNHKVAAREMFRNRKEIPRFYMVCGRQDDLLKVNMQFSIMSFVG